MTRPKARAKNDYWNEALEAAAKVAEYHHEYHCENRDGDYRNCGLAIAVGIRDLKKSEVRPDDQR